MSTVIRPDSVEVRTPEVFYFVVITYRPVPEPGPGEDLARTTTISDYDRLGFRSLDRAIAVAEAMYSPDLADLVCVEVIRGELGILMEPHWVKRGRAGITLCLFELFEDGVPAAVTSAYDRWSDQEESPADVRLILDYLNTREVDSKARSR